MRRACQARLIYHLRCGIPVSQALPVWRGCQQPLQIARQDRRSEKLRANYYVLCGYISKVNLIVNRKRALYNLLPCELGEYKVDVTMLFMSLRNHHNYPCTG